MDNEAKREMTLEELEAKYKALGEVITKKKAEEEKRKQEELARTKEVRRKEIEEKEKELCELKRNYIKDYGNYVSVRDADEHDFPYLYHLFF